MKVYVVTAPKEIRGIYASWAECKAAVTGVRELATSRWTLARRPRRCSKVAESHDLGFRMVGARGFEPLTSSVSGKRSPTELSARAATVSRERLPLEAGTGIEPVCGALQAPA